MAPNPSYKSRKCQYCREPAKTNIGGDTTVEQLWPPTDDYQKCPICQEGTYLSVTPYFGTYQEKEAERKSYSFGWYLLETWLSPISSPSTS